MLFANSTEGAESQVPSALLGTLSEQFARPPWGMLSGNAGERVTRLLLTDQINKSRQSASHPCPLPSSLGSVLTWHQDWSVSRNGDGKDRRVETHLLSTPEAGRHPQASDPWPVRSVDLVPLVLAGLCFLPWKTKASLASTPTAGGH